MTEKRILVVDDEKAIRDLYAEIFAREGYVVQCAESAEEALVYMKKTPSWVLFVDLNLPGMNGVKLCRQIRAEWPMAIAFAVTGYASVFQLSECREAGFEDYFTKPVPLKELRKAAAGAFERLARWKAR